MLIRSDAIHPSIVAVNQSGSPLSTAVFLTVASEVFLVEFADSSRSDLTRLGDRIVPDSSV